LPHLLQGGKLEKGNKVEEQQIVFFGRGFHGSRVSGMIVLKMGVKNKNSYISPLMRKMIGKSWMSALVLLAVTGAGYGIIIKHVPPGPDRSIRVSSHVPPFAQAGPDLSPGRDIYHNADGSKNSSVYPPFWAMANIPLTLFPPLLIDTGWYVLNV